MDQSDCERVHAARAGGNGKRAWWTTKEFAESLDLEAQSIRKRYSQTGSYFGVRPVKLANGRLAWPAGSFQ